MWAQRLVELRRTRGWIVADTARELKQRRRSLPSVASLSHMIRDWESGKHRPGPQYQVLLSAVYAVGEAELFGGDPPSQQAPTGDDDEMERRRLLQALAVLGVFRRHPLPAPWPASAKHWTRR
jgi:hypothetical protein